MPSFGKYGFLFHSKLKCIHFCQIYLNRKIQVPIKNKSKPMLRSLLICFCCLLLRELPAQSNNSVDQPIIVKAMKDQDNIVRIRWAPTNFGVFKRGNQYGYLLTRYTIAHNNEWLNTVDMLASKVELGELFVLPDSEWEPLAHQNDGHVGVACLSRCPPK